MKHLFATVIASILVLMSSCSTSRHRREINLIDSTHISETSDSMSIFNTINENYGSSDFITIRKIVFDTSRLDSLGNPLKSEEITTTIHHKDSLFSTSTETTSYIRDSVASETVHSVNMSEESIKTKTSMSFELISSFVTIGLILCLFLYMYYKAKSL